MQTTVMKPETVLLLDWDDTLLCSSFLQANSFKLDSTLYDLNRELQETDPLVVREQREVALQLRELETCVVTLLRQATASTTRTVIVTNAEHGWVQLSAAKFLPGVVELLDRVTVISARSTFEPLFPGAPLKWKYFAFHEILVGSGFFGRDGTGRASVEKHVISLGDSHVEREAVRAVCKSVPATRTKSVKFTERPTIEQLRRQLELVNQCFNYITTHDADLDLQLTVTLNPPQNPAPAAPAPSVAAPEVPLDNDASMLAADAKDVNTTLDLTKEKSLQDATEATTPLRTMVTA